MNHHLPALPVQPPRDFGIPSTPQPKTEPAAPGEPSGSPAGAAVCPDRRKGTSGCNRCDLTPGVSERRLVASAQSSGALRCALECAPDSSRALQASLPSSRVGACHESHQHVWRALIRLERVHGGLLQSESGRGARHGAGLVGHGPLSRPVVGLGGAAAFHLFRCAAKLCSCIPVRAAIMPTAASSCIT